MRKLARHESLLNLFKKEGLGLITTNEYEYSITKAHLLQMRSGYKPLVSYMGKPYSLSGEDKDGRKKFYKTHRRRGVYGPALNGNFYGITKHGLEVIAELEPELKEEIDEIILDFTKRALTDDLTKFEIEFRKL